MASTLASLLKKTHIEDHDEILKSADAALKQSKGDLEAQHVKAVALLNLDRYADAVTAIEAGGEKLKDKARLEYAYALYKSGKPAEAADIAAKGSQRGYSHIEAQARYRTEDFERAAELYRQLSARQSEDLEADLRVNSAAVDVQLEWAGKGDLVLKKKPEREDMEAFETAYNAACGCIARGELGQADVLLKRSKGERWCESARLDIYSSLQIFVNLWMICLRATRKQSFSQSQCSTSTFSSALVVTRRHGRWPPP